LKGNLQEDRLVGQGS